MSSDPNRLDHTTKEAANWFAVLNGPSIPNRKLEDFYAWRRRPGNDDAYRNIEGVWRKSGQLSGDPDVQSALAAAKTRAINRRASRQWIWPIVAVGATAAAALIVVMQIPAWFGGHPFWTGVGEQKTIALEDGSTVRLDTSTRIVVQYSKTARRVKLSQGQAMFDVVHRTDRPFTVQVGQTVVQDLGTRFDVRKDSSSVKVILVAGALQIIGGSSADAPRWTLKPGQQLSTGPGTLRPRLVDAAKATSWTTGRLTFEDVPLADAVTEINRYAAHKVILQAEGVQAARVTGDFEADDTNAFVGAVAKLYNLDVSRQGDGQFVLRTPNGLNPA